MNVNYWIPPKHELLDLYAWVLDTTDCSFHFHDQLELMLISKGTAIVSVDFQQYTLTAGDILFLFPNRIHHKEKSDSPNTLLRFGLNRCPAYTNIFENKIPISPVLKSLGTKNEIQYLFSQITLEFQKKQPFSASIMDGYINALIGLLLRECELQECIYTNVTLEMKVISYCAKNFRDNISLDQISNEFGISKYYLSHLFSQRVGIGLFDFITTLRLNEACRLLSYGEKAAYVAMASGFSSIRVFNYTFKQKYGITPTEYKTNYGETVRIVP